MNHIDDLINVYKMGLKILILKDIYQESYVKYFSDFDNLLNLKSLEKEGLINIDMDTRKCFMTDLGRYIFQNVFFGYNTQWFKHGYIVCLDETEHPHDDRVYKLHFANVGDFNDDTLVSLDGTNIISWLGVKIRHATSEERQYKVRSAKFSIPF